jgi:hypothetical protein
MLPFHIGPLVEVLLLILALPVYLLFALYAYAPFKTKVSQVKRVQELYEPIEISHLPPEVSQAFFEAAPRLASMGFVSIGAVEHQVLKNNQRAFVSIWVKKPEMDFAQVIGVTTYNPQVGLRVETPVTFRTEFTDDTYMVTSTSKFRSVFPVDRRCSAVRCPGFSDFQLLYRLHRARVEQDRGSRAATLHRVQDPVSRLEMEHTETYVRLVKAGYYKLDSEQQRYVPTLKGAFFMTYRLLPPFKQISHFLRWRTTNRTLRRLGFGNLRQFELSQSLR